MNALQQLLDFLSRLDRHKIHWKLSRCREEAIMVEIAVTGERWEVEFFANCEVETEIFGSSRGIVSSEEAFQRLFTEFGG